MALPVRERSRVSIIITIVVVAMSFSRKFDSNGAYAHVLQTAYVRYAHPIVIEMPKFLIATSISQLSQLSTVLQPSLCSSCLYFNTPPLHLVVVHASLAATISCSKIENSLLTKES